MLKFKFLDVVPFLYSLSKLVFLQCCKVTWCEPGIDEQQTKLVIVISITIVTMTTSSIIVSLSQTVTCAHGNLSVTKS